MAGAASIYGAMTNSADTGPAVAGPDDTAASGARPTDTATDIGPVIAVDGTPRVGDVAVADIVRTAHDDGIDAVLGENSRAGLISRATLEQLLVYCAENRCQDDAVTCPGCRRDTEAKGITSLDAHCARFERIHVEDTGLELRGPPNGREIRVASLENLARSWAGEEYWFWARRVLRKVRFGVRRSDELFEEEMAAQDTPSTILVEPQIAENIGMVARAMANFGLDDLHVVNPRDGWPSEKARAVASGASAIVDGATIHGDFESAISEFQYVVATTARQRDMRKPILTPETAAAEMRRRIAQGQRCAMVFGRERNGLQSDEVANCHAVVMIPVNPRFASLNLAQAVLLTGYAWLRSGDAGTLGRVTGHDRRLHEGLHLGHDVPARHDEIVRFFEHLEGELDARGFFHPPERKHVTVRNLRSMFLRMDLTAQEVRTLRGIIATITKRGAKPGVEP